MSQHVSFCSACDRPVPVTERVEASDRDEPQLVCLDYGRRCSGAFCPMVLWTPAEEALQSAGPVGISSAGRPPLP